MKKIVEFIGEIILESLKSKSTLAPFVPFQVNERVVEIPEEAEKTWHVYRYKIPIQDLIPLLPSLEKGFVNGEWYIHFFSEKNNQLFVVLKNKTFKISKIKDSFWDQMVSFKPSILMFAGTKGNPTENNILETGCFGVNFVHSEMAKSVFECIKWHGQERIEKSGFGLFKANNIQAPLIAESKGHLECKLVETKEIGSGFVLFGEIVAASIWDKILEKDKVNERYALLDQIEFLEDELFSRSEVVSME